MTLCLVVYLTVLFVTAPVVSLRCRIYATGDTEVDFTSCIGQCSVTIYLTGSSWRYYRLNCEENCVPRNKSLFGLTYITTCCSYDLCSLRVLRALEPCFRDYVEVERINANYESSFSATSTAFITSNTSFTLSSITRTLVEPMFTSSPSPSPSPSNINMCLRIVVSGYVVLAIVNIVLLSINIFAHRAKKKRDQKKELSTSLSPPH